MDYNCNHKENRREDWGTPPELIKFLETINKGPFEVDLAAREDNAVADIFIDPDVDFLSLGDLQLAELHPYRCWCNPPYGKRGCKEWIQRLLKLPNVTALVRASVGARWFQPVFAQADFVVILARRLKHVGAPDAAKFDSALIINNPSPNFEQLRSLADLGPVISRHAVVTPWSGRWPL